MNQGRLKKPALLALLLYFLAQPLWAVKWAILPVRVQNLQAPANFGPRLSTDAGENARRFAQILQLYLEISTPLPLVRQAYVQAACQKLQINVEQKLSMAQLRNLARELDADQLLVSSISSRQQRYEMTTLVYHTASEQLTDPLSQENRDLWKLISSQLEGRFAPLKMPASLTSSRPSTVLLGLDASGSNYREIQSLAEAFPLLGSSQSAACAIDGNGNYSFSRLGNSAKTTDFLQKLSVSGGQSRLAGFQQVLQCLQENLPRSAEPADKKNPPLVFLLAGNLPENELQLKGMLRRLSARARIIILGSGALGQEAREYWLRLAEESSHGYSVEFQDIIYFTRVGLSTGDEWSIFKRGMTVLESQEDFPQPEDKPIPVPAHLRPVFLPEKLVEIYSRMSKNRVVSSQEVKPLLSQMLQRFVRKEEHRISGPRLRVLLEQEGKAFWVSLPYSPQIRAANLAQGESYYFLLNFLPAEGGIPVLNSEGFGRVYQQAVDVPLALQMDISSYLKDPAAYLNRSLGGSSLYVVFATVRMLRLPESDVLENY